MFRGSTVPLKMVSTYENVGSELNCLEPDISGKSLWPVSQPQGYYMCDLILENQSLCYI